MSRLKEWIIQRFLPVWCKEELEQENKRLRHSLERTQAENEKLHAYIDGIHTALRRRGEVKR